MSLIRKLVNDEGYQFNPDFLVNYLHKYLEQGKSSKSKLEQIFKDVIENDLYGKDGEKLIAWFMSSFGFQSSFLDLLNKSEYLQDKKHLFEDFSDPSQIDHYCSNEEVLEDTINELLNQGKEQFAM